MNKIEKELQDILCCLNMWKTGNIPDDIRLGMRISIDKIERALKSSNSNCIRRNQTIIDWIYAPKDIKEFITKYIIADNNYGMDSCIPLSIDMLIETWEPYWDDNRSNNDVPSREQFNKFVQWLDDEKIDTDNCFIRVWW